MASNTVNFYWYNLALTGTSSCLSLFGGAVIIFTYIKMKEIRNFTRTLLVYLTIADLFTASGNLIATVRYAIVQDSKPVESQWTHNCSSTTAVRYEPVCVGQSFVTTVSNLSSFIWTAIIAFHICLSVVLKTRITELKCFHIFFHIISWCVPLAIVSPLLAMGYLGEDSCYGTGVWCGIRSGLPRPTIERLMFLADIAWQLVCYVLVTVLYMYIKFQLYVKRKYAPSVEFRELTNNLRNEDKNFLYVVIVIYSLKIWGIMRFFLTTFSKEDDLATNVHLQQTLTAFLYLQSYGASGQAFWNFILFCVCDQEVREHLKQYLPCKLDREMRAMNTPLFSNSETNKLINSTNEDTMKNSYV